MSLTSPIFPSIQIILRVSLQISNNLTTFSFMMELTLSSVSHTKMKLQFSLLVYTLSIATEEKNKLSRHDVLHPEFCKPLLIPFSAAGCKCLNLCLIACIHAQTVIWYARPLPCCHQHAFLGTAWKTGLCGPQAYFVKLWQDSRGALCLCKCTTVLSLLPQSTPSQEKDRVSVLNASATMPFVSTTARSCPAQTSPGSCHEYFGMQVTGCY